MIQHLRALAAKLRGLFRDRKADQELEDEIEAHLRLLTERYVRQGMSEAEAARAARRQFGNVTLLQEVNREMRGIRPIETLLQDLRYGGRMLGKNPGFTFVATLTLALGIGATTTIFSVVNTVLIRPLPYKDPDRLVTIWSTMPQKGRLRYATSYPDFKEWKNQSQLFEGVAISRPSDTNLTGGDIPEIVRCVAVSPNLFQVLGMSAMLGRTFLPEDEQWGRHRVVVLSYGLWQRRFGGELNVIGREVQLDSEPFTVIGVISNTLNPQDEMWKPLSFEPGESTPNNRSSGWVNGATARLKPGVTVEQADEQMKTLARRLEQEYPDHNKGVSARVALMAGELTNNISQALLVLFGAVGFVLLIACVNVANLLLARAIKRDREIAIRSALGASRFRLLRQLLTESVLLALIGGVGGLTLGYWGVKAIVTFGPRDISRLQETSIDLQVMGFILTISLLTSILFGLIPALRGSQPDLQGAIKEGGRSPGESKRGRRSFQVLVIFEVALAIMLMVGAGLLIRSFQRLQAVTPGFQSKNVLTARVTLPSTKYDGRQRAVFVHQLLERLQVIPGVQFAGAATTWGLPLGSSNWGGNLRLEEDLAAPNRAVARDVRLDMVTPGYFQALGIPLLKGRIFTSEDTSGNPLVAIVSESLAQRYFPNEDPIGKRIWLFNDREHLISIVGVVGDVKFRSLEQPIEPTVYGSQFQGQGGWHRQVRLIVRTNADPLTLVNSIHQQVRALDKDQPVAEITTMDEIMSRATSRQRFNMMLLGVLALVALILSVVGIYGVSSHFSSQRAHEIGIRMALGAHKSDVLTLILRQGLALALIGIALGIIGSLALTRVMERLLFEVSAFDLTTFVSVSLILSLVVLIACYIPARRATKINPLQALRHD
jgi:putative ABC transport system permease protein